LIEGNGEQGLVGQGDSPDVAFAKDPIRCVSHTAYIKSSCPDEENCGWGLLMLDVRNAIADILDRYSLEQAVSAALEKLLLDGKPLPYSQYHKTALQIVTDYQI